MEKVIIIPNEKAKYHKAGEPIEVTEELAMIMIRKGWAVKEGEFKSDNKSKKSTKKDKADK